MNFFERTALWTTTKWCDAVRRFENEFESEFQNFQPETFRFFQVESTKFSTSPMVNGHHPFNNEPNGRVVNLSQIVYGVYSFSISFACIIFDSTNYLNRSTLLSRHHDQLARLMAPFGCLTLKLKLSFVQKLCTTLFKSHKEGREDAYG